jgi:2-keto-4-pentenoate hydratase/2-oxohepta-3-ene-1,7-dioic acid hydratase in catechol pathway
MHLASIEYRNHICIALRLDDSTLVDADELLLLASDDSQPRGLQSMKQLISGGPQILHQLESALARIDALDVTRIASADVRWLPPVVAPGKVCAVAMNNSASNERKISAPDHPAFFLKPPSCLIGHNEAIRIRPYYGSVHPEPELALVIGKKARDVPSTSALEHVFGYTIFNDVTGNAMRAEDRFHYWAVYARADNPNETERVEQHLSYAARYKGTDTFGVMGPWLVTADSVSNPDDLSVHCKINGETIAEDSTRYYNYSVAEVVSFLSYFLTLNPGDVISLGTAFKPSPDRKRSIHHANLQTVPGPIEISIEGLGTQESTVVIEKKTLGAWRRS